MKIYLASDHAGFELKEEIKKYLQVNKADLGLELIDDLGTYSLDSVNWAEYGAKAAQQVSNNPDNAKGIIVCGSGIGMSMVANKFKNVRAALCNDKYAAEMSRKHNNANVLNMGARILKTETALDIVNTWLKTDFEGGRHQDRIDYLHSTVENNNFKKI